MPVPLHLAFHVRDLDEARKFYVGHLGASEVQSAGTWVDFDFFGHRLSLHLGEPVATTTTRKMGDHGVPIPHFGVVLTLDDWTHLAGILEEHQTDFVIAPSVRFKGEHGEHWTMFLRDPSGNAIEIKGFPDAAGPLAQ